MSLWADLKIFRHAVAFVALLAIAAFIVGFFLAHGEETPGGPAYRSGSIAQHHSHPEADSICEPDDRIADGQHGNLSDHWHDDTRTSDVAVQGFRPRPCSERPHLSVRRVGGPVFRVDRPPTRPFRL